MTGNESNPGANEEELVGKMGLPPEIYRYKERSPFYEMVSEGTSEQVKHAVAMRAAWMENELIIEGRMPNTYPALLMDQEIKERTLALRYSYLLGFDDWPKEIVEDPIKRGKWAFIDKEWLKDTETRGELIETLEDAHESLKARQALLTKLDEQLKFSADIDIYLKDYFLRWGKNVLPSHDYGVILNLKETHKGFIPLGEKVETALKAFREIGEGKAKIGTKRLPNVFSFSPNRGSMEFVVRNYVSPKLRELRGKRGGPSIPQEELERRGLDPKALMALEDFDDRTAAILALGLFRHFDLDVYYSFGKKASGKSLARETIAPGEWGEVNLETGAFPGDSSKAAWFEVRRSAEWGREKSEERREHPRNAGTPMSFGCYPVLTTHMLDIVATEMLVTDKMLKEIGENLGLRDVQVDRKKFIKPEDREDREDRNEKEKKHGAHKFAFEGKNEQGNWEKVEVKRKIRISVNDRCFEEKIEIPVKIVGEKKERRIEISYLPIHLREILWDDVKPINSDVETDDWLEFRVGPQTDAYEIPYKLQGFYAFVGLYSQIMRSDFLKQYEEVATTNLLRKMNKQVQNALVLMSDGFHLSDETANKLSNYVRCVFLGSLGASVVATKRGKEEKMETRSQVTGDIYLEKDVKNNLINAARTHLFLTFPKTSKGDFDLEEKQRLLIDEIFKNRKAPLPGDLKRILGREWFTEGELEKLKPLYPLGLTS